MARADSRSATARSDVPQRSAQYSNVAGCCTDIGAERESSSGIDFDFSDLPANPVDEGALDLPSRHVARDRKTYQSQPLAEQVIVITGATSGIGLVTVRLAARAGAKVVALARNEAALRDLCAEIRGPVRREGSQVEHPRDGHDARRRPKRSENHPQPRPPTVAPTRMVGATTACRRWSRRKTAPMASSAPEMMPVS